MTLTLKIKLEKIYRKDTNVQRKRAKIVKSKKGRITKIYAINTERKTLLKQRREKVLQNAKDRKLARAIRASNDTQNTTNTDATVGDANTDAAIDADIIDNAATDADIIDNAATDADNADNPATDADNTDNATTDGEKSDDATLSDTNTDNAPTGEDNTDKNVIGKASIEPLSLPPHSKGKAKDPSQIKTPSKHAIPSAKP